VGFIPFEAGISEVDADLVEFFDGQADAHFEDAPASTDAPPPPDAGDEGG
jgi:hypothetical protein